MNPKQIKSILALTILLTSLVPIAFAAHDPAWYTIVQGVLYTDTYDFYPYNNSSIDFGYSKYGEVIAWDGSDGWVGIQYPGYDEVGSWVQPSDPFSNDPFAKETIARNLWLNGWFMEVRYTHISYRDRRLLTMAMFADMADSGNDWNNGFDLSPPRTFANAPHGGRKTTGYAETEDAVVLYDGPRKYIVETLTHVYDWFDLDLDTEVDHPDETWAVVDVKLTFIFNKAKKQVIILKDIKKVIEGKELLTPLDIQFSNREEVDLGPEPDWESYAHFYHQDNKTCYGPDWHMASAINREYINDTTLPDPVVPTNYIHTPCIPEQFPWNWPAVEGSVRVYLNGNFLETGIDYTITSYGQPSDGRCDGLTIRIHPEVTSLEEGDVIRTVFKVYKYTEHYEEELGRSPVGREFNGSSLPEDSGWIMMDGVPHLYDMVQVISSAEDNVLWKAYWPILSDYTPDGWPKWWTPLIWEERTDLAIEPGIPFTIGEWDFMLGKGYPIMFRGVEVVGVSDHHHSSDADMGGGAPDKVETEIKYMLEEVFNPWDLEKAVHKATRTWVEWKQTSGTTYTTNHRTFAYWPDNEWGLYNEFNGGDKVFSERVYDLTAGRLLLRSHDYDVTVDANGYGYFTGLPSGHKLKIMYHTLLEVDVTESLDPDVAFEDNLGVMHVADYSATPSAVCNTTAGNWTETTSWSTSVFTETDFKVFIEENHTSGDVPFEATLVITNSTTGDWRANVTITGDYWYWITHSMGVDVNYPTEFGTLHVQEYTHQLNLVISVTYTDYPPEGPEDSCLVTITDADFTVEICEMMGGRWEHTVVGKDASSVDSIGAALVTAAFKNKQIEIGIGSLDMEEEEVNDVPWVMRKFGDGMAKLDYHHYAKPDYDVDVDPLYPTSTVHRNRTSVKDDWCHTWQISGANLISIGGPGANLLSYYLNDFTDAIYGLPMFTPSYWSGAVAATTCWNKNYYFSGPEKGYAVIGTYHDINGTTALTIWGVWGRDTYYASRFFHEELIYEFQKFDPCITSVILEIDYTDKDHPTFDIVEVLGTISEHTDWTEMWDARKFLHTPNSADYDYQYPSGLTSAWTITKGGIHDP